MGRLRAVFRSVDGGENDPVFEAPWTDRARHRYRKAYWRLRRARQAPEAVATYGPEVERLWGVPLAHQQRQLVLLALRYGFDAEMYYRYRLYRLDDLRDASLYVPRRMNRVLRRYLREHTQPDLSFNDKRQFAARCRDAGLPVAPVIAEFDDGRIAWGSDAAEETLPPRDLFSKPVALQAGQGASRWRWDGTRYLGEDDVRYDPEALVVHLRDLSRTHPYMLQPRLVNVGVLDDRTAGALATLRITTTKVPGSDSELIGAFLRMSTTDGPVDNFDQGGLAARVEPETGALSVAIRKPLHLAANDYTHHPVSGSPIVGTLIPQWNEALALALEAHRRLDVTVIVGWDLAVTTDGVLFIEANSSPCARAGQQPGLHPYGATAYTRTHLAVLDV
ncbi:MAG: sugar-transfer associated ATP-grasp domain-containing protein [Bacteroidota bacterium]